LRCAARNALRKNTRRGMRRRSLRGCALRLRRIVANGCASVISFVAPQCATAATPRSARDYVMKTCNRLAAWAKPHAPLPERQASTTIAGSTILEDRCAQILEEWSMAGDRTQSSPPSVHNIADNQRTFHGFLVTLEVAAILTAGVVFALYYFLAR
jgi:hypothetical protein